MSQGFDSLIRDEFSHRPPGRPPLDDIDLALTLLDRGDHFDRLEEWLDQRQPSRAVIVLPAAPSASYAHFVCRIVSDMQRNLGRDPIDLGQVPARSRALDEVLEHLAYRLRRRASPEFGMRPAGSPSDGATVTNSLSDLIGSCRSSVIFSHIINQEFVNVKGRKFLTDWVQYFSQKCPTPASGLVLAILCLQSTSRDDVLIGEIRNALAGTRPDSVLMEAQALPEIPPDDVPPWAVEIRSFDRYRNWNSFFSNVHMGLFDPGVKQMPFEQIRERVLAKAEREVASLGLGFREIC